MLLSISLNMITVTFVMVSGIYSILLDYSYVCVNIMLTCILVFGDAIELHFDRYT